MIRAVLTHDVDRIHKSYQCFTKSIGSIRRLEFKNTLYHIESIFHKNKFWGFDKIIDIESHFNIKSTFFFLHETIRFNLFNKSNWKLSLGRYKLNNPKISIIIKWLDENGWEISLHGSFNSFKDLNLLKTEKKILEQIVGHEIIGIRQHYLNLNDNTWKLQQKAGFKYDSSWGFTNDIGFKGNIYKYFLPLNNDFVVFPLVIMDDCFMKKQNKWDKFLKIIDIAQGEGGLLVINWHQRVFNEKEFPEYSTYYIKIIDELKKRKAKFYRLSDYYKEINNNEVYN